MQAIADRSNSSIGALYNYFPDKDSIAVTLRLQYSEELRARLKSLMEEATKQSAARFTESFIDCILDLIHQRPAYLVLHAAAIRIRREPAARKALRSMIADVFRAKNPSLSSERALLAANVAVQIVKGMATLYSESETKSRGLIEAEFRKVLSSYLGGVLSRSRTD
jgi:AcrR family transcriptional regulator